MNIYLHPSGVKKELKNDYIGEYDFAKYQEVEYIQSQSTWEWSQSSWQYINTWYKWWSTIKIEIKISWFTQTWSYHIIWSDYEWEQRWFAIWANRFTYYNTVITLVNNKFNNWNTHILQLSKDWFYNDWTIDPNTLSTNTFQTPSNITIFALNRNWSVREYSTYKLHYLKIRDNGTLVRNFVPCYRKSDNVIGLYDLVNKQFYTNAGSWTFTKWPDVN